MKKNKKKNTRTQQRSEEVVIKIRKRERKTS